MSGIGRVPGTPAPVVPDDTTTTPTTPTTPTAPTAPTTPTRTPTAPARPTPPAAPATAGDIVPPAILTKYGLDPTKPSTESKYEGQEWSVGYYPYDGNIQYVAFGKYKELFGNEAAAADMHGYWEAYGNPPTGLESGSWIGSGSIDESDFEKATGIDISGDRPIDNSAYKLMREAGAPMEANFALRDKDGKQLAVRAGDKLLPTMVEGGKFVEVEVRNEGEYFQKGTNRDVDSDKVTWRLKGSDGAIRGAQNDKAEDRFALAGAKDSVKFDFLDAAGEPVSYNPPSDSIVETYKSGNAWHALLPKKDAQGKITGYEHQTLDGEGRRVTARATVDPAAAAALKRGKEVMNRIQERTGGLKGDGKVGDAYDMGWWGKCHNVAAIGASSMKLPEQDVKVVTNRGSYEKIAVEWREGGKHNVLVPTRNTTSAITGYALQERNAQGAVASSRNVTIDEANRLVQGKETNPVIVTRAGKLKAAEVTTVGKQEVTAMVAHMGDGAVEYKGSVGSRYYGVPDSIRLKDGSTKGAFITSVETQSGKKVEVGSKSGSGEYSEEDRSILRGPGLNSNRINQGYRNVGWSAQDFAALQGSKTDKIKNVTVTFPDGRTETIGADKIQSLGWENRWDVSPTELWSMHKNVGAKGSSVIEKDPGTHVWNYTIENMSTKPMKATEIPAYLRDAAKRPGMMAGTTDEAGKHYFSTTINGEQYHYWAKFDAQNNLKDYAYISDNIPDFFWTQHVKDPVATKWTGEAQAPGARMEDIQKVYNASTGRLSKFTLPGGVLGMNDLNRRPTNP